jgi:hypothetical protein
MQQVQRLLEVERRVRAFGGVAFVSSVHTPRVPLSELPLLWRRVVRAAFVRVFISASVGALALLLDSSALLLVFAAFGPGRGRKPERRCVTHCRARGWVGGWVCVFCTRAKRDVTEESCMARTQLATRPATAVLFFLWFILLCSSRCPPFLNVAAWLSVSVCVSIEFSWCPPACAIVFSVQSARVVVVVVVAVAVLVAVGSCDS